MEEIVELRGHHLGTVARVHSQTFEENARNLIESGYADRADDLYVELNWYGIREIFSDPKRKVRIIADKPDFICRACRKIDGCFDNSGRLISPRQNINFGPAFAEEVEKEMYQFTDETIPDFCCLVVGRVYTVQEIRKRLGF